MKLKDIYKENLGRKYRNVIDTKGREIEIKSVPFDTIKKNKYTIIIISLITILILLLTFRNTLNTFFIILSVATGIFSDNDIFTLSLTSLYS